MKIVAIMASDNRVDMTRISCERLKSMGCEVVLVLSNKYEAHKLKEFKPHVYRNNPLGAKWQHAVDHARNLKPDYLITCGSDDLLRPDYIDNAMKFIDMKYEFVGVSQWYMEYHKKTYKAWYSKTPEIPIGGGRIYTAKLLDRMGWALFDKKAERRLDDYAHQRLKNRMIYVSKNVDKDGLIITAVKGGWAMLNPMEKFFKAQTIGIELING